MKDLPGRSRRVPARRRRDRAAQGRAVRASRTDRTVSAGQRHRHRRQRRLACGSSAATRAMMIAADAIIANLTPFRGPGADAGTVYELGYMAGRGKLCLGYSNDPALLCRSRARIHRGDVTRRTPDRRAGVDGRGFRADRQSDDDSCARSARLRAGDATHDARGHLARPDRVRDLRAHGGRAARRFATRRHRVELGQAR